MGRNPRTSEDLKGTQSSEDKRATGCSIPACTRSSQWHTRETSVHLETGNVIDPVPVVVLRVGVLPPRFIVEEVENEPETYFIKVQEDMSPVIKNTRGVPGPEEPNLPVPRVFAFENEDPEKWVILHREDPEIYTIQRKPECGSLAWTAPRGLPDEEPEPDRQVLLERLIIKETDPPTIDRFQLFQFQPVVPA